MIGVLLFSIYRQKLLETELFVELINTAARIYELLLAGKEGVTLGADLNLDILLCAARFDDLATRTSDSGLFIIGVDSFLHVFHLFHPE